MRNNNKKFGKNLSNSEVGLFVRENGIKSYYELFATRECREKEWINEIFDYVCQQSEKSKSSSEKVGC